MDLSLYPVRDPRVSLDAFPERGPRYRVRQRASLLLLHAPTAILLAFSRDYHCSLARESLHLPLLADSPRASSVELSQYRSR